MPNKVQMLGPNASGHIEEVWIDESQVLDYEQRGYWVADKIPKASDAPSEAIKADTRRGRP